MRRLLTIRRVAILLAASTAPFAAAQRTGAPHASFAPHSLSRNYAIARGASHPIFRRSSPSVPAISLPFPFFGDSFDPGSFDSQDLYSTGYPVASTPPPYILRAAGALAGHPNFRNAPSAFDAPEPSQPLLIELQNGRYVRVNGAPADGEAREIAPLQSPSVAVSPAPPVPTPLPLVALLFRDGHTEEVRDYTIADGFLYARGDFYTDGYWNKKISVASLDVPRTLAANAARKVNFNLPTSPNEVITRP